MLKSQLIIIAVAVSLVVVLYSLPKVIINKSNKDKLAESSKSQSTKTDVISSSGKSFTQNDLIFLQNLRKKFSTVSDKEKKLIFADSLAKSFVSFQKFDSATKYAEEIVLINNQEKGLRASADIYFNMFNVVEEPELAADFASKARSNYEKLLAQDADNLDIQNNLAMTYTVSDNPMQAVLTLRNILQKDPKNQQALFNLGLLSIKSGQFGKAEERFKSILEINPTNWEAYYYLGIVLQEQNKKIEAQKAFEKILKNASDPSLLTRTKQSLTSSN
jgi:tetratricopeptide (TPR) repeat protein